MWASDEGPSVLAAALWVGRSPQGEWPDDGSSQITNTLNGPVNFFKSLNADV